MSANLRAGLAALLDQYDETRRESQSRKEQAAADGVRFLEQFAELRRAVVRPVFEAVGAMLRERGHRSSIREEEFELAGAGQAREAAIILRIVPAGTEKAESGEEDARTLSFRTRHYNRTVSVRNGAVPHEGAGAKSAYAPERIQTQLVEEEVLKLFAALVKG